MTEWYCYSVWYLRKTSFKNHTFEVSKSLSDHSMWIHLCHSQPKKAFSWCICKYLWGIKSLIWPLAHLVVTVQSLPSATKLLLVPTIPPCYIKPPPQTQYPILQIATEHITNRQQSIPFSKEMKDPYKTLYMKLQSGDARALIHSHYMFPGSNLRVHPTHHDKKTPHAWVSPIF